MDTGTIAIELVGWISTAIFLLSIVVSDRIRLHQLGIFAALTTGAYAYYHGATAIWVKWAMAFFFHLYMIWKLSSKESSSGIIPLPETAAER